METRITMNRNEIDKLMKTIDDLQVNEELGQQEEEVIIDAEGSEQTDNKNEGTAI